jgi:hypothetical protein
MRLTATTVVLGALLVGCSDDKSAQIESPTSIETNRTVLSAPNASNSKVDRAARISRAIQADPDHAEDVLRQNGMTEDQFEALLYEIAADPQMSRDYSARTGQ